MAYDFHQYLISGTTLQEMPAIIISERNTDKRVIYDKKITRLDRIAGDIYGDETLSKIILWANPAYFIEFDIPDGTVIRVPFPANDVIAEVVSQIVTKKDQ